MFIIQRKSLIKLTKVDEQFNMIKLSKTLKQLMYHGNISVKQLAAECNLPANNIYDWLNSNRSPKDMRQLKAVANFFGTSVDHLLFGDANPVIDKRDEINCGVFEVILKKVKKE